MTTPQVAESTAASLSHQTTPTSAGEKEAAAPAPVAGPKKVCGMRRRWFWTLVGAIVLACVIVACVVGGVVGTRNARHGKKFKLATPMALTRRSVAASSTADSEATNATLQVVYQDLTSTNILYRLVWANDAKEEQTASLSIQPREGTPLAVVAANSSTAGDIEVNIFYMTDYSAAGNNTGIVRATLDCTYAASSCTTSFNEIISANVTDGPRDGSGLAAVQIDTDADQKFRVFYHSDSSNPTELYANNAEVSSWSNTQAGGASTPNNSTICANAAAGEDTITIFFVLGMASSMGDIRQEQYQDALGISGSQTNRTTITVEDDSGFNTTSKFTSVYSTGLETYYIHYVKDTGGIGGYIRNSATNDTWTAYTESAWGSPESGIASVAWGSHVRLLYLENGELVMSASDASSWASVESI